MMKKILLSLAALLSAGSMMASENDLLWDYTDAAPTGSPDDGLYYGGYVNDAEGINLGLKGIKLNSSGYAYFEKAAVAGTLKLTISHRKNTSAFQVNVSHGMLSGTTPAKGELIAVSGVAQGPTTVSMELDETVTGIYIDRYTSAEGVLSKVEFIESVVITGWTIAGDAALMGSTWDATDTSNDMVYDCESGNFELVKENVQLTAGTYQYKAVANHDWAVSSFPAEGNNSLAITEDGTYNVTFAWIPGDTPSLTAVAVKQVDPQPELPTLVFENGNGWTTTAGAQTYTKDGIKIATTQGVADSDQYRVYKSQTFTVSSEIYKITKLEFTCTANGTAKYGPGNFTGATSGTYTFTTDSCFGTWAGEPVSGITLTASGNQVRFTKLVVTYEAVESEPEPELPTATFNSKGLATFSAGQNLNIKTEGVKAYKAAVSGETITLTALEGYIPAGTGVILSGEAGTTVEFEAPASGVTSANVTGNALKATTKSDGSLATVEANSWALKGNEFLLYTGSAYIPNRAYLVHDSGSDANELHIVFADAEQGNITGIESVEAAAQTRTFDLNGRRATAKGLQIKNGKAVFVK